MIKIRRYTLSAKPERTVVLIPVRGASTLMQDLFKVKRTENIPNTASVNLLTRHDGTRALRIVWDN